MYESFIFCITGSEINPAGRAIAMSIQHVPCSAVACLLLTGPSTTEALAAAGTAAALTAAQAATPAPTYSSCRRREVLVECEL